MRLTPSLALVGSGEARLSDAYDCNVYLVDAPDGPVLVDTGSGRDTERILQNARDAIGEPVAAVLTHAHADHSQGGPDLQDRSIPVVAPSPSRELLALGSDDELGITAAKRDDVYPAEYEFTNYRPDRTVEPGTNVSVAGRMFEVVRFRGHASDHVCYVTQIDGKRACFVGDAVYPDGSISLLNVPGSSLADYRSDVSNLEGHDVDALLPGHGLPRLEDGQECIEQAAAALGGMFTPPSKT
ncbi:hypothetical protein CV102_23835 [Natronococcus pandeyae]|uniref:Metallo-beta-lactamase domain-containing protein n=1 Tax=Natronococcus pandeyae TaxID=2055836 RepID=A0A8J8PWK3_9EURY|nr:MBL fold metallo-hydrolase [Natronococcus pandeyae]TYL36176.1 hypothetical protein CV102_23835 [Natronococcus pandeyae]